MELKDLIPLYGEHDTQFKELKKICDVEKEEIKNQMKELDSDAESYGGFKVTRSVSKRESFNEEKALNILKNHGLLNAIKTREYIDMDALENEIYQGSISNDVLLELDECRSETEVVTLKCTKTK